MHCTSCTRQLLAAFVREVAGINFPSSSILSRRQISADQRISRNFSCSTTRDLKPNARLESGPLSASRASAKDDTYLPFDTHPVAQLNSSAVSVDLPAPFAIPNPPNLPIPDEERSRIGHLKDPDFEPEIELQNIEAYSEAENGAVNKPVAETKVRKKASTVRSKLRAEKKDHEERLARWRERNGIAPPDPTTTQPKASTEEAQPASPNPSKKPTTSLKTKSSPSLNRNIRQATNLPSTPTIPAQAPPKEPQPSWGIQKAALLAKFPPPAGGWSPIKRLSPDALDGIRALHSQYPSQFPTAVLAAHFKISPEAIRRILKSKWRPNAEEDEERRERWERRGEKIWKGLVEKGVHPPKRWREAGIGAGGPRKGRGEWLKGVRERDEREGRGEDGGGGFASIAARIR